MVTKIQLGRRVSIEIVKLFEVARGAVLYGWYFYPLCTLASEQLLRVYEAAARERCLLAGFPTKKTVRRSGRDEVVHLSFAELINTLVTRGMIPAEFRPRWDAARKLRNSASHPSLQSILTPGDAISTIQSTAICVNALFNAPNPPGVAYPDPNA